MGLRNLQRFAAIVLATLALAMLPGMQPALAQPCNSDFQCSPSAGGYNVCLGNTLIMRRRICVGGQCMEQETGRLDCGGGSIGGRCEGNTYVSGGNRCDALSGRCAQGSAIRIACTKACSCVGRALTISTGTCSAGTGCGRVVMRCQVGCTCAGEPRCTEDPTPAGPRGAGPATPDAAKLGTARAAPGIGTLPPRIAEPFEPAQTRVLPAQPARVVKIRKAKPDKVKVAKPLKQPKRLKALKPMKKVRPVKVRGRR